MSVLPRSATLRPLRGRRSVPPPVRDHSSPHGWSRSTTDSDPTIRTSAAFGWQPWVRAPSANSSESSAQVPTVRGSRCRYGCPNSFVPTSSGWSREPWSHETGSLPYLWHSSDGSLPHSATSTDGAIESAGDPQEREGRLRVIRSPTASRAASSPAAKPTATRKSGSPPAKAITPTATSKPRHHAAARAAVRALATRT